VSLSLYELPLPLKLVPAAPIGEDEFLAFAKASEPYRVEKNAQGEIIVMTPVGHLGSQRETEASGELMRWARMDGRGEAAGPNAAVNLPDASTLSPDAYWVSKERLAALTPAQLEKFLPLCPEFILEIRSQSDSVKDQQAKMDRWMANGAQLGWLIDPFSATVYIYRPGLQPEVLPKPEVMVGEGPIAGFRLEMERFWA
jgi:Uma2 family endonuclease